MNWVDLFLGLILLLAILGGLRRGFILGSLDLLSWIGSLVLGYTFYPYTAQLLDRFTSMGVWLLPVAFLSTVIIIRLLIGLVTKYIVRSIPDNTNDSGVNRFLGLIPGAINGLIYVIILSALLLALPLRDNITEETRNSKFAGPLAMKAEWVNRKLAPVFDDAVRQTMNSLTVHPSSHEKVTLSFKTNNAIHAEVASKRNAGFGIANLTKRLTMLYGADFDLKIDNSNNTFSAFLKIPVA